MPAAVLLVRRAGLGHEPVPRGRALAEVEHARRGRELRQSRDDRQLGLVDGTELVRVGMHVHEALTRARDVEQPVATRGDVAEPAADRHEHVGLLDALPQRGHHPDPRVARQKFIN